jgi:2-dehydro-3-deoxyphosphooctonate aldolase (KDO 8-P synthase)
MKLCGFDIGLDQPFFLIAGPCVVESEQLQMDTAGTLKEITAALGIPFIFKSSFDKANRSRAPAFAARACDKGLEILAKVKRELGLPTLTDVHSEDEIAPVAAWSMCCRRRPSCAARPTSSAPWRSRASRSTSRRASSWRPAT